MAGRIRVVPRAGTWIETRAKVPDAADVGVVPRAGTWIETQGKFEAYHRAIVVPRAGTWIETQSARTRYAPFTPSFPVRERGLKRGSKNALRLPCLVVPRAGTWIETAMMSPVLRSAGSFPVRERGLKPDSNVQYRSN